MNTTMPKNIKTRLYIGKGQMVNGCWSFGIWFTDSFGFNIQTPWFRLERTK